jgi:GNAT superfamily N-acetyltransferase
MALSAPVPLTPVHVLSGFTCGIASLDDWLVKRALANEASGASRTFVVTDTDLVAAYYALATGSVPLMDAPGKVRRNMPDPVPVMVLARLAVDQNYQGLGLGQALLKDALLRTVHAADFAGIRAVMVHAISEEAKVFYLRAGFVESPHHAMTLFLTLQEIRATLQSVVDG